jgi:maltose O-acetyltransferase
MERRFFRAVNSIQAMEFVPSRLKIALLRMAGCKIGGKTVLQSAVRFIDGRITLGERVFINRNCLIEGCGGIEIGSDVHLAFGVSLITSTHQLGSSARRCGPSEIRPIKIGAGAWLGANVTVLPGVTIGHGAVIAAGSVLTTDVPADCLMAGVPAVLKKQLGP